MLSSTAVLGTWQAEPEPAARYKMHLVTSSQQNNTVNKAKRDKKSVAVTKVKNSKPVSKFDPSFNPNPHLTTKSKAHLAA